MTRETKIGLLVGLAFIIVIGILLSDHLTSSTEPPPAALANAGNTVRQTVTSPGTAAPPITAAPLPTNTAPQQQIATQNELTPGPNPSAIVKVGPGNSSPAPQPQARGQTNTPGAPSSQPPPPAEPPLVQNEQPASQNPSESDTPTITKVPPQAHPIAGVAQKLGEELVLIDGNGRAVKNASGTRNNGEYVAQAGDTLSKIAGRFMGGNTRANRDAIVGANPSLKGNPDRIIVGRTYLIPGAAASSASSTPAVVATTPSDAPPATAVASGENWYTVKPGDSLWKIATEQCGRGSAVAAIKELNKDVLRGEERDQVTVGMKIKLPNKSVAQSN